MDQNNKNAESLEMRIHGKIKRSFGFFDINRWHAVYHNLELGLSRLKFLGNP